MGEGGGPQSASMLYQCYISAGLVKVVANLSFISECHGMMATTTHLLDFLSLDTRCYHGWNQTLVAVAISQLTVSIMAPGVNITRSWQAFNDLKVSLTFYT